MIRKTIVSVLLIVAMLSVGWGVFSLLVALRQATPPVEPERPPLTVNAVRLAAQRVVVPVEGFGTARADRLAAIEAEVRGRVVMVADGLRDGARVEAGALLVRLDEREYTAQLQRARSQLAGEQALLERIDVEEQSLEALAATAREELEVAQREYTRVRNLLERGNSNERELDAARVVVQRARRVLQDLERQLAVIPQRRAQQEALVQLREAEVQLGELNVERCEIRAPFSGQLDDVQVELGEQVAPGQALLLLMDPSLIEVPIELPVSQRELVRVDATARLWLESRPDAAWEARVARVSPRADAGTRTFSLFLEVRHDAGSEKPPLMPGMFVEARVDGPTLEQAMLVPRSAVRRDQVVVCENGAASKRTVRIRRHLRAMTMIDGLEPGDVVITSNLDALHEGTPVRPVFADEAASDEGPGGSVTRLEASAQSP
jgi:multidrug efflux pump subunit AcrA (membrane-fusion protein)